MLHNTKRIITIEDQITRWGGAAFNLEEIGRSGKSHLLAFVMRSIDDFAQPEFIRQDIAKFRPIKTVILARDDINASATTCVDQNNQLIDLIGLTAGTIAELGMTFDTILKSGETLTDLKKLLDEVASSDLEEAFDVAVAALSRLAINFVLWHETRHLVNGHVDFLTAHHNVFALSEIDSFSAIEIDILRYTFEYDADCSAVNSMCFDEQVKISFIAEKPEFKDPIFSGLRHIYLSEHTLAYYFGFCICVFFSLSMKNFVSPYGGLHHPASHVRMMWILGTLGSMRTAQRITADFMNSAIKGCLDAFVAMAKVKKEPIYQEDIRNSLEQSTGNLQKEIQTKWGEVRQYLEPLSRAERLAPSDPDA
jgi:hypothetical protein